jgi:hypothetical protein
MSILDNLPHRATATKRMRAKGTLGGSRDTWEAVFANRPCWRQVASHAEILEFDKRGMAVTDKVYFTTDPELDERHRLTISGDIFEVRSRAIPDASAGLGVVYKQMVELTTTGST